MTVAWWFLARPLRRCFAALVAALSLAACLVPSSAAADPIVDKRAEAERLGREIDEQGRRISVLAEQVNNARLEAGEIEAAAALVETELARTEQQVADARSRLRIQAVNAYVRGGSLPAVQMLMKGTTDDLAIRRSYVETIVGQERAALGELHRAQDERKVKQASLNQARSEARQALAAVEAARRDAAAAATAQQQTLAQVQGELAALVEADRRRREEEAARRAREELARRQAAEEAAQRRRDTEEAARRTSPTTTGRSAPTTSPAPAPAPAPGPTRPPAAGAQAAIEEAKKQLGKPYEWGADGPDSFDCSGLTQWAWKAGGKYLPHSSQAQFRSTSRVSLAQIQPGDLLFYGDPIHHVGLYVGDGRMIEASQTGTPVRYASIYRSDMVGVGRVG